MGRWIKFENRRILVPDDATDAEIAEILGGSPPAAPAAPQPTGVPEGGTPERLQYSIDDPRYTPEGTPNPAYVQPSDVETPPAPAARGGDDLISTIMSGLDYADDTAAIALANARKGVSGVVGLPVDLMNAAPMLANLLPGVEGVGPMTERPFMGSDFVDSLLGAPADAGAALINEAIGTDMPGAEGPAPVDMLQRIIGRVGKEIGAAAVPVGGAIAKAAGMTRDAVKELPSLARMFVEPAVVSPGRFAGREAAAATGAGLGASIANEVFPEDQTADLIGAILGAATTGLGGALVRGGGQAFNALRQNPHYADQVVKDAVTDRIARAANVPGSESAAGVPDVDPLVRAIMDGNRMSPGKVIPGYKESLADVTGNPGLAATEYSRQQGPSAGAYITRRSDNTEAVEKAMQGLEPGATPGALRTELAEVRDRRLGDAAVQRQNADDELARIIMDLSPQTTPAARGNTIRTALEESRDALRARTDDAYAVANVANTPASPEELTAALDNSIARLTEAERGLIPQGLIDRVAALGRREEPGPVDTGLVDQFGKPITREPDALPDIRLKEATDLKSELLRLQRAALADPRAEKGGRNAARVLGQMADTVESFIQRSITPEQADALATARGAKFDEAERFGRQGDPVADVVARREGGQPKVLDEQVAGRFVSPRAMDRLFAEADTPATRAAIRDEVLSRGDTSSVDRITRFLDQYGEQVDRFPGLRAEFENAATARGRQVETTDAEKALQRDLGTPDNEKGRGTIGRYLQFSDANAERAISEVLAAKDPGKAADELLSFVGDKPQAVEGARAAFWKKLRSESQSVDATQRSVGKGDKAWRGDWLKSWLDNPATAAVAERLYRDNPEHLERIREIAAVLDNTDLRVRGKASASSGTSQGVSNILTPETLQSRLYAYMRGQVSGTYLATSIAAVIARRAVRRARGDAIERMTDQALLNPEFAAALLKENNPANRAAMARRAKGWLGNEAATFVDLLNEEEDEVKNKAMEP